MLTWSLGWTSRYSPFFAPRISTARFASTSLTFRNEVPAQQYVDDELIGEARRSDLVGGLDDGAAARASDGPARRWPALRLS